jgi:hypothetical protein
MLIDVGQLGFICLTFNLTTLHARIGMVPPGGVNRATFAARESQAAAESARLALGF